VNSARVRPVWPLLVAVAAAVPSMAQEVVDLPGQDKELPAALEEVFRVGSLAGADWETFGEVGGVGFDAQGRLYVFDRQSSRFGKVHPGGRQGRRGAG